MPKLTHGGPRKGAGRPPLPKSQKRIRRPIGFTPVNLAWLKSEAKRTGESMGDVVNGLIERAQQGS